MVLIGRYGFCSVNVRWDVSAANRAGRHRSQHGAARCAIERRLKKFWENTSCPRCGHQSIVTWEKLDRIWCRDCNFKPVFVYGTPFHEKHLAAGEVLLAFTLYADTLLSINQIAPFLG